MHHILCGVFYFCLLQTKKEFFMSRQIQHRRGDATAHTNFIGAIGEITMDTTNKTLRVHDGETAGGIELARSDMSNLSTNGMTQIKQIFALDWNNTTDYTNAAQITIPSDGILFCRGATRSMDWVESDFTTPIMVEYVLSSNYSTVWAPVFAGQCLKNRSTSDYQKLLFIPYKSVIS